MNATVTVRGDSAASVEEALFAAHSNILQAIEKGGLEGEAGMGSYLIDIAEEEYTLELHIAEPGAPRLRTFESEAQMSAYLQAARDFFELAPEDYTRYKDGEEI